MKILLIGKNGQVGWELNRSLLPIGEVVALGRQEADLSNPEYLRNIVRDICPEIVVNAAAYTAVDKAEEDEKLATIINGVAPGVLAEEVRKQNALLVHYSTDYVFDGTKDRKYSELDEPSPANAYGRSKLAGELAIQSSGCDYLIFRTSWVYAARGSNFLLTILKLARERDRLSVVADQIGSPTSARLIADTTLLCIQHATHQRGADDFNSGLYHLTASGHTSWYGFAKAVIESADKGSNFKLRSDALTAIPSSDYPTAARRPLNSRLDVGKLEQTFDVLMPSWEQSLSCVMSEHAEFR